MRPTGSKLWRYRYRFRGKENVFALGEYPALSLADARKARDGAKKLVKQGTNPAHSRKLDRLTAANASRDTFEAVALKSNAHSIARPAMTDLSAATMSIAEHASAPWCSVAAMQAAATDVLENSKMLRMGCTSMLVGWKLVGSVASRLPADFCIFDGLSASGREK